MFPFYSASGNIIWIEKSFLLKHPEQNILTVVFAGVERTRTDMQIPDIASTAGATGKTKPKLYF